MHPHPSARLAALALAAAGSLVACGSAGGGGALPLAADSSVPLAPPSSIDPALRPVSGSIRAFDQPGDGTTVQVSDAEIHGASGWIVIHVDQEGPGDVVGHAPIPEGASAKVVVTLDRRMPPGGYWAMLHRDEGVTGTFEWPGPDGPVRPANGTVAYASRRFVLTAP